MTAKSKNKTSQKLYKKSLPIKDRKEDQMKLPGFLHIKNSTYDIIKKIVAFLPLVTALYVTLAQVWGWGFGEQIDATITAVVTFLNGILGVFMVASSSAYHEGD